MRDKAIEAIAEHLLNPVMPETIARTPFIDWIALTDAQAVVALDALLDFLIAELDERDRLGDVIEALR